MADTVRTPTDLLTNVFQDGQFKGVSAQDMRDLIVSLRNPMGRVSTNVPALTGIVTQDVMVKAAGTTTLGPMPHQVDAGGSDFRLRYTGTITRHFHIALDFNAEFATGNNLIAAAQLYLWDDSAGNGALVDHTYRRSVVAGQFVQQITMHSDIMMDENDYIDLYVANTSGVQDVTLDDGYMFMMGIF